jgi:hypothetical protein
MAHADLLHALSPASFIHHDEAHRTLSVGGERCLLLPTGFFDAFAGQPQAVLFTAGERVGQGTYAKLAATLTAPLSLETLAAAPLPEFTEYLNQTLFSLGIGSLALTREPGSVAVTLAAAPFAAGSPGATFLRGFVAGVFAPLAAGAIDVTEGLATDGAGLKFYIQPARRAVA